MRATRRPTAAFTAVLIAVATIALAACGDDDADDDLAESSASVEGTASTPPATDASTPSTGSTEPTEPTVPTTEETSPPSSAPGEPHGACVYRRDLVLVRSTDGTHDDVVLDGLSGPLAGPDLAEQLGAVEDAAVHLDQLLVDESMAAYRVEDGQDPLDVANAVESAFPATEASPVLLTTITGHWTFAPGDDAVPNVPDPGTAPDGEPDTPKGVAVVDTGYSDEDLPEWLALRAEPLDAVIDAEPTGLDGAVQGHGPFVASLIAQEAPDTGILVARVGNVASGAVWTGDDAELQTMIDTGHASDELQLYVAVARLPGSGEAAELPFEALNVSLGSYTCGEELEEEPGPDTALLDSGFGILGAINLWNANTSAKSEDAPVFAAAGNHTPGSTAPAPFIPAAYEQLGDLNVFSIGSVDVGGVDSDFSNSSRITALGRRLVGVRDDGAWWAWSGTSFAFAVATATYLNNEPVDAAASPLEPAVIQAVP